MPDVRRKPRPRAVPWVVAFAAWTLATGCVRRSTEAEAGGAAKAASAGPVAAPAAAPTVPPDRNAELAAIAERERAAVARPAELQAEAAAPAAAPAPTAVAPAAPSAPSGEAWMSLPPADEAAAAAKRAEIERRAAAMPVPEVGDLVPNMAPNDIVRENLRAVRAPGERRFEGPDQLIRRVRHAAANRDLKALSRYMTPRLAASTEATIGQHEERFWTHMARYVTAGSQGFKMETSPGPDKDSLQLVIEAEPDIVLRPIVQRRDDGWYFDRF